MIDPHIQAILEAMAESGFQLPDPLDAAKLRTFLDAPIPAPPVEIAERRDVTIKTHGGMIAGRLYHPAPSEKLPVVLFFHGGGWVHGTLETHDRLAAVLAVQAHCAVVSVDYRLAPEHPFPAAWDDAVASLQWVKDQHDDLNIDANRIALVGDSAGGNLAAALAIQAAGDPAVVHQLLIYPVTDGRCSTPGFDGDHLGFLSAAQMRWYWDQYAPDDLRDDPRASPAAASLPAELAPATVMVAGNDPLHDEGEAYFAQLGQAGIPATLHAYPGGIHGFVSMFGLVPIADEAVATASAALRSAFA